MKKNTGILIIRELPDTVTANKTEAEAYSAVWDLMIELEKNLPMAFVFMVRTHLWKIIKDMMKLEYFFQIPSFKTFRKTCSESRGDYICQQIITLILWKKTTWKSPGMIIPVMTVIH